MSIHYLMLFAQEKLKCAVPELESIGRIFGINLAEKWAKNQVDSSSMRLLGSINEQDVKNVMSRSVLTKSAFEIWGVGRNLSELKVSICAFPDTFKLKHFDESKTFAVRVKGIGKKVSLSEQVSKMDALEDVLPFHGKVNLTCPDAEFYIIEDYLDRVDGQSPAIPSAMYFGRLVCHGQRSLIDRYSLKKRKFIGNTSMDPTLAMVMANLACSTHGHLTCDPFVGTGSLLVAAAHFGSHVIGGDINYNILHAQGKSSRKGAGWREKDETVRQSLAGYKLGDKFVDVLVCDCARHAWNVGGKNLFDGIITDPPYGIREACQRVGSKREEPSVPSLPDGQFHIPEQTAYHLDDIFKDLINFSVKTLTPGGRLVYWLPVHRADYSDDVIPRHPMLRLVYNCEQILNSHSARRLIVMEKLPLKNGINSDCVIKSKIYSGHNAFRDRYFKV
ncbi:tRNA (guanine(10)-N(2))-methyltransferase TRMT11-like isoform X2 [Clavelina lepadiformis]|uniref:tRNA (guanine(10)-N(2))-methyltransferase TRMT11 n=1 Tax=Clavelina lepadiformis TaxID=159417 RepID=A0ABP0GNI5_CLALP